MKKKSFHEIEFYILKQKEKDSILLSNKGFSEKKEKGDYIYTLNDGQILYEMIGVETYLFKNINDFNYFEKKCEEIANGSVSRKTEINDLNFIEKRFLYIDFFKQAYKIDFNVNDLKSLNKIDDLLNKLKKEDILKYRLSIVAIIGESIISNTEGGKWKNFEVSKSRILPCVFVKGSVVDPVGIFYNQFYQKKAKKTSLSSVIKKQIESL